MVEKRGLHAWKLVGRDVEMESLIGVLNTAQSTNARGVAVVEGEAGIGKSRLLHEVAAVAGQRGMSVHRGRADEMAAHRPFRPLLEALECRPGSPDQHRRAVAELTRQALRDPSVGQGQQLAIVDALLDVLERSAIAGPVCLIVDDLQWADPSTLLALYDITRHTAHLPVALVYAMRPWPRETDLQHLLRALDPIDATALALTPLGADAAAQLAELVVGPASEDRVRNTVEAAEGNPLYVTELVRAWADGEAGDVPTDLQATILDNVRGLREPTRTLLRMAALLGAEFGMDDLSVVADASVVNMMDALSEGVDAKVLEQGDAVTELRFRHDLIRDAIYEEIPPAMRLALHREAADRLIAADGTLLTIAEQLQLVAQPGDDHAASWLRRAGEESGAASPQLGRSLLTRARVTATPGSEEYLLATARLAALCTYTGELARGEALAREAVTSDLLAEDPDLWLVLMENLWRAEKMPDLLASSEDDLDRLPSGSSAAARIRAWRCISKNFVGGPAASLAEYELARQAAIASGDILALGLTLAMVCPAHSGTGDFATALSLGREAVEVLQGQTSVSPMLVALAVLGVNLVSGGRFEEAGVTLDEWRSIAQRHGQLQQLVQGDAIAAERAYLIGEWDDAVALARASLAHVPSRDLAGAAVARAALGRVALLRGDLAVAREELEAGRTLMESGAWGADRVAWLALMVAEATQDPDGATLSRGVITSFERNLLFVGRMAPTIACIASARGDRALLEQLREPTRLAVERDDHPWFKGNGAFVDGMADDAPNRMVKAADLYHEAGLPLLEARAREEAGMLAAGVAGDEKLARSAADPLLKAAASLYRTLAADHELARVRKRMRGLGIRLRRSGRSSRPAFGWEALTPSEMKVVGCAAEGLTNGEIAERLFVSRHTVHTHMKHVFTKLGIGSRVELAVEASTRGISAT